MMETKLLFYAAVLLIFGGCRSDLTDTLSDAGDNRTEILAVIDHYSGGDPLKLECAEFLIRNLPYHFSTRSMAMDSIVAVLSSDSADLSDSQMERLWKAISRNDIVERSCDVRVMKSVDIISNIDRAFAIWNSSPWKDMVSFRIFCDFILPHRVMNEPFVPGWRESLWNEYHHIIEDETDVIKAYEKVHREVMRNFRNHPLGIPYIAPLRDIGRFGTGSCIQGCVYETAVMRALGIPAAIDGVSVWSNYSRNGHAWCALVLDDATYTMTKHDTVASRFNIIDSSTFPPCDDIETDYPYETTFRKRVAKIQRNLFSRRPVAYSDPDSPDSIREIFANPHTEDVTCQYLRGVGLTIRSGYEGYVYLCVWRTGYGWYPVACARNSGGIFRFDNLGDSTLYLPVVYRDGKPRSIMNPVAIESGRPKVLDPDKNRSQRITVDRKYPLVGKFIDRWCAMRGGRFVVGGDSSGPGTTVATISITPVFRNEIRIDRPVRGKNIRYVSPANINYPITEIEFYRKGCKLQGTPVADRIQSPEKAFDGDTYKTLDNAQDGYSVGLSFDSDKAVDRIVFYPQNDDNFVVPGEEYELLCFDREWKTLAKKISTSYSLDFVVPQGALLMLRNTSKGNESRPFIHVDNHQKWF